jgi:hypothetical protein
MDNQINDIMEELVGQKNLSKNIIIGIATSMIQLLDNIEKDVGNNTTTSDINMLKQYIDDDTYIRSIMEKCCNDKLNFLSTLKSERLRLIGAFSNLIQLLN